MDKFAYEVHPIHVHESGKCQALEVQIVWLDTVETYFTCVWLCLIVYFHAMKTYESVEA
jgi:hypothetical protein